MAAANDSAARNGDEKTSDNANNKAGEKIGEQPDDDTFAGFPRFELELEFVQSLSNPYYLNHLAAQKDWSEPEFVNYLEYLQYWKTPPYTKYLNYPQATFRALEALQSDEFRKNIIRPDFLARIAQEWASSGSEANASSTSGIENARQ